MHGVQIVEQEQQAKDGGVFHYRRAFLRRASGAVFGKGAAGDIWRSMLSEQVSRQIAKSDALGIAKRLFASHPLGAASEALEEVRRADSAATAATAQMSANSLALPSGADVDSGAVLFAGEKRS